MTRRRILLDLTFELTTMESVVPHPRSFCSLYSVGALARGEMVTELLNCLLKLGDAEKRPESPRELSVSFRVNQGMRVVT